MWQDIIRIHLPFHLPVIGNELVIHGFGLAMVVGFLLAVQLAKFLARKSKLDPEVFVNAALIALFTGILGARMSHVLENLHDFTDPTKGFFGNLWAMLDIGSGGLTYYGGFILAFPILVIYAKIKKIPLRLGMDIIAPCLMIGLGLGRVGCFLNGCCYGANCNEPFAVTFPYGSYAYDDAVNRGTITPPPELMVQSGDTARPATAEEVKQGYAVVPDPNNPGHGMKVELSGAAKSLASLEHSQPVHPAQLYSTFTALLLAAFLVAYFSIPHVPGHVFAAMMVLEGISRFTLELLRVEPAVWGHFSLSMILGLVMVPAGLILWFIFSKMGGKIGGEASESTPTLPAREIPALA